MKNRHGPTHTSLSSNNVSNNRTVHIGNIPSVTTIETLQSIFSKYGEITNIKLAGDPSYSKRFAFIEYAEPYQAKSSLCLDGTEYLGQILKISLAKHDFNSRQHQRSSSLNQNKITTTPHHYRTNSEFSTDSDVSSTTSSINISSLTASLPQIPTSNNSTTVSNSSSPKKNNTTNNLIAHSSLSPSTTTNNSTMTQSISPTTTDHGTGNNNESTQQHTHHPQINTSSPSTKKKSTHQHHHTTLNNNNNMVMPQDEMSVISSPLVTSMYLGSPTPASPSSMYIGLPLSQPIVTEQNVVARTIHISGIDIVFTEDELLEYFGVYGDVTNYRLCNNDQISTNSNNQHATKFAFIEYARADQALKALMVNGTLWGKSKLKVSHSKTAIQTPPKKSLIDKQYRDLIERTIHIGGIDVKLSQDSVKAFFEELCGTVHRIAMAGDTESYETRFCFIEFEDKQSALKALRLTGCTIAGSVKQIKVSPSKSPIGYSKNKLMMIGIGSASNPSPPSPLHHQLNQLHLNSHTSPPPSSSSTSTTTTTLIHHAHHPLNHHNTHHHLTSTPTTPGNAAFTNAGLVPLGHLAIPANLAQAATASNLALFPTSTTTATTGTTTLPTPTSQNSTNSVTTTASTTATPQSFPTIFPFAPWAYTANTTATLSNQGSMDPSSQGFFSYPQMQMIHPQYYFYTTTPTMTYGAVALPNSSFNTSTSYNLVPTTTQETHTTDQDDTDTDNVKRKRDQHESFDESSNALYQKKLKDK